MAIFHKRTQTAAQNDQNFQTKYINRKWKKTKQNKTKRDKTKAIDLIRNKHDDSSENSAQTKIL